MVDTKATVHSRTAKWGWGILLGVSALLVLNGAGWFFVGPDMSVESMAENLGVSAAEFAVVYPDAANSVAVNAHQVAIWFMAFGSMALLVSLAGLHLGVRWAWHTAWVLVAAVAAVGARELAAGEVAFGSAMLMVASIALVAQLLARRGLTPK